MKTLFERMSEAQELPTPDEDVERVARAMFPQLGQEGWRHYDEYWLGKARAAIGAYERENR